MQKTKWIALFLVFVLVFVTACSSGGKSSSTPASTPEKEASTKESTEESTPAADLDPVTLDWYLGLGPNPPDLAVVNDALNKLAQEDINTTINLFYWTGKEFEEKMTTMVSSGQDVGITGFGSQSKLDYVVQSKRGGFYPMEGLFDEYAPGTKALFDDAIWKSMTIDDHIYGIPSLKDNCYIISMVYNADMAEALGINMDEVKYTHWKDMEPLFDEVLALRNEKFPEYADMPLVGNSDREMPYNFAIESFLNDSFMLSCNIDGLMEIEGYDDNTVFNLYNTPEYLDLVIGRQRMVENGIHAYDYEGKSELNYTGGMFAWLGWGYTYMQSHLYGDAFTTKMVAPEFTWTDTNNFFSAGSAISAACKTPERAMMFLELINTDSRYATLMRMGVEGEHYVYGADGKMTFEGSVRNSGPREDWGYHVWYGAPIGNLTIVEAPEDLIGPDGIMLTKMKEYNDQALKPRHLGFVLDVVPIENELAACTNVVLEYRDLLRLGQAANEAEVRKLVAEFNEKLVANGVQKIIDDTQRQITEWEAAK